MKRSWLRADLDPEGRMQVTAIVVHVTPIPDTS
jgi:hypothetical protein